MPRASSTAVDTVVDPKNWARIRASLPRRRSFRHARWTLPTSDLEFLRRQVAQGGVYPLSRVHIHQELADARVGVVEVLVFVQRHLEVSP